MIAPLVILVAETVVLFRDAQLLVEPRCEAGGVRLGGIKVSARSTLSSRLDTAPAGGDSQLVEGVGDLKDENVRESSDLIVSSLEVTRPVAHLNHHDGIDGSPNT